MNRRHSKVGDSDAPGSELFVSDRLLDDLFVVLAVADADGLQVLKRGGVAKSEVRRLAGLTFVSAFHEPTFPRGKEDRATRFLLQLAFTAKLLAVPADEPVARLSGEAEKWLALPLEAQLQRLFEAWLSSDWDELYQIPNLRVEVSGRRNSPSESRAAILTEVSRLEPDRWYPLDAICERVFRANPSFLRPASDPYNWRIAILDTGSGYVAKSEDSQKSFWLNLEGNLIRNYIYDPLFWLGVVKLGLSKLNHLTHFAVTETGRELLCGHRIGPGSAPQKKFFLQPDFEITADREFDRSALLFLNRFANRTETDLVFKFRITKHSIARGLERGIGSESILSFLREHSVGDIPQNVEFSIKEWSAKYGNIRIKDGVLLEAADEFLMSELVSSKKIAPYLEERLGSRAALVDPEHVGTLYRTLKREGYLPELDNAFKKLGPDFHSYSFSQQQSVAVFASALALTLILKAFEIEIGPLMRLLVDEEFLAANVPQRLMLQASFLSGEICDLILLRAKLGKQSEPPRVGTSDHLPPKAAKSIKESLNSALLLGQPVAIEYVSPITQTLRTKKFTVSEIIDLGNDAYVRGVCHQTNTSRLIEVKAIRSVSPLR